MLRRQRFHPNASPPPTRLAFDRCRVPGKIVSELYSLLFVYLQKVRCIFLHENGP